LLENCIIFVGNKNFNKMQFTPSEYQKTIFDFIRNGSGNAVINAKAGSGKTTTLVEAMKLLPEKDKALFVAFNKAIANELEKKVKELKNVKVRTYHGLGYAIFRENYGNKSEIQEYKYTAFINKNISRLSPDAEALGRKKFKLYKQNIKQLVDFARYNLAQSSEEIFNLCKKYSIEVLHDECEVVPKILEWGKTNLDAIDYTDMVWICVENQLETRSMKFDYIFIDEAQDSSIMQQALIKKCFKRGTRFVAIGDEFQCINAFAGADSDAFNKFKKEANTTLLKLPISYRCPSKVIEYVKKTTGVEMEVAPNAIEGDIKFDVSPFAPVSGDMVLCRNTAHLVKLYMKYVKINKKAYLKGRSIAESFKSYIENTDKERLSLDMIEDGVFPRLYERLFDTIVMMMERDGLDFEDAINTRIIMDMIDSIKALEALAEGIVWAKDLLKKIDVIFTDDDEDGVCLSTIHKAKGLEADNVFILCDSLMPSKFATKKWEIESEQNLIYVALTRPKKCLHYICEKQFPANLYGENKDVISDLEYMKTRMERALKRKYTLPNDVLKETEIKKDVKNLLNTHNIGARVVNEKKRQNVGGNKFAKFLK
jgi:DNA helicase-2/ATP-dependent DNA helicase PcrA